MAGHTQTFGAAGLSDLWLVRTDNSGDTLWTRTYGGVANDNEFSIQETALGGFIVAGATSSFGAGGSDVWLLRIGGSVTGVDYESALLKDFVLRQNYPNPFNPSTSIEYTLSQSVEVSLIVFNLRGQEIAYLVNEFQQTGNHSVTWNATDFSSGIYIYRLQAGDFVITRKMVLLK